MTCTTAQQAFSCPKTNFCDTTTSVCGFCNTASATSQCDTGRTCYGTEADKGACVDNACTKGGAQCQSKFSANYDCYIATADGTTGVCKDYTCTEDTACSKFGMNYICDNKGATDAENQVGKCALAACAPTDMFFSADATFKTKTNRNVVTPVKYYNLCPDTNYCKTKTMVPATNTANDLTSPS